MQYSIRQALLRQLTNRISNAKVVLHPTVHCEDRLFFKCRERNSFKNLSNLIKVQSETKVNESVVDAQTRE